jgi:hypothetical protein
MGKSTAFLLLTILAMASSAIASPTSAPDTVEQWGLSEITLHGPADGNPFTDVKLSAQFVSGTNTLTMPGFYDGDGVYRIRFSPPAQGNWTYRTHSNAPALDGQLGSLTAIAPTGPNHGPVRVFNTFHFAYADGTPMFLVGTTCYAWTHQPDDLEEQTLKTLSTSPFNKMRMCIFPKSYAYNTNDPPNYPFVKGPDGKFDFTRFDPANWQHLERRIQDLQNLGIQAELILFHPYDRWGFAKMDPDTDDRYVRYAIARLSAYRNVWWSLANEYDFMIPALHKVIRGNKTVADFDRFFSILQKEDPYDRQRSIHHSAVMYDHTKPWVTHASIQDFDVSQVIGWREKFQKPIVVDECRYEGNIPKRWGALTAQQMVHQFWLGTICGGYIGHGETLKDPNDILWWSKGGTLHGQSPPRIAFLRKTMEALPFWQMTPTQLTPDVYQLSKPGEIYLVYAVKPGPLRIQLAGTSDYHAEAIDTWNMTTEDLGTRKPAPTQFEAPHADYLLRLSVAKPH